MPRIIISTISNADKKATVVRNKRIHLSTSTTKYWFISLLPQESRHANYIVLGKGKTPFNVVKVINDVTFQVYTTYRPLLETSGNSLEKTETIYMKGSKRLF